MVWKKGCETTSTIRFHEIFTYGTTFHAFECIHMISIKYNVLWFHGKIFRNLL